MNSGEMILYIVSTLTIFGVVYWQLRVVQPREQLSKQTALEDKRFLRLKWAVFATLCIMPLLFLATAGTTQFFTADEPKYLPRFVDITKLNEIVSNSLINGYRIIATLCATVFGYIIPKPLLNSLSYFQQTSLAKGIHWYCCLLIMLAIGVLLFQYLVDEKLRTKYSYSLTFWVVFCYSFFGLSQVILIFKIVNYDSFSALLGVLALLIAFVGVTKNKTWLFYLAVVVAVLAALEKPMAVPVLLVCMSLCVLFALHRTRGGLVKKLMASIAALSLGFVLVFVLSLLNWLYLFLLLPGGKPVDFSLDLNTILWYFYSLVQPFTEQGFMVRIGTEPVLYTAVFLAAVYLAGLVLYLLVKFYQKGQPFLCLCVRHIRKINAVIALCGLLTGVWATYFLPAKVSPWAEYNLPFGTKFSLNSALFFFDAATPLENNLKFFAYQYAAMFNSMVTVLVVMLLLYVLFSFYKKKITENSSLVEILFQLTILGSSLMPLVFGFGRITPSARYNSLFLILWFVLVSYYVVLDIIQFLRLQKNTRASSYVAIMLLASFCIGTLGELAIYYPNGSMFRPAWNLAYRSYADMPKTGIWHAGELMNWGDNNLIASVAMEKYARENEIPFTALKLYSDYSAPYPGSPGIAPERFGQPIIAYRAGDEIDTSKYAFYCISRFMLVRSPIPEFMYQEKPIITVSRGGENIVWVFTGEQLAPYLNSEP